jgi:(2Fe-2S) ferredoxin
MRWDDEGKSSEYDIEFYSNRNLSELNQELFAPDLSTIRPGWVARYQMNNQGVTRGVKVFDQYENLYYFYQFNYGKKGLRSKYFRADSVLVGSHTIRFGENKKPVLITYYNENGIMKNAIAYEYPDDAEKIISQINSKGEVIERRIIPKKE